MVRNWQPGDVRFLQRAQYMAGKFEWLPGGIWQRLLPCGEWEMIPCPICDDATILPGDELPCPCGGQDDDCDICMGSGVKRGEVGPAICVCQAGLVEHVLDKGGSKT